jgi:hypothetical protein
MREPEGFIELRSEIKKNIAAIDSLVLAYNARDARAFARFFTEDAVHGDLHSENLQRGREAIARRYTEVFTQYPENRTEVVHRSAFGRFVVDHERVQRGPASAPFDVIAIYTKSDGLIARCDFVR